MSSDSIDTLRAQIQRLRNRIEFRDELLHLVRLQMNEICIRNYLSGGGFMPSDQVHAEDVRKMIRDEYSNATPDTLLDSLSHRIDVIRFMFRQLDEENPPRTVLNNTP